MPLRFSPARGAAVVLSSSSRGPKGDTGDAATIAVGSVTTLPAGSNATVANAGTTAAAVFNFGIPRGADGEVAGPGVSVDGEIALYNGITGATIKRAATTGLLKASSGVLAQAVAGTDYYNPGGTDVAVADGGTGASDASGARTNLGVAIGSQVQAYSANLAAIAALSVTDSNVIVGNGSTWVAETGATARTSLGLGTGDSPQFTAVNIGNASDTTISRSAAGVIAIEGVNLTPGIPQNSQSTAYTAVLGDANTHLYHPSSDNNARTFTIPANASVAYPVGTFITFVNEINTMTIAITSDTLTLQGAGTTGSRTLAANGIATALKVASTKWVISGTGLT